MRFIHPFHGLLMVPFFALAAPDHGAESAVLSVRVREQGQPDPLPCRVWIEANGKRLFHPTTVSCTPYERDRSFSCDGEFSIEVPPGQALVHVERGKEYIAVDQPVTLEAGNTLQTTVDLHRWINMQAGGWYSADMHVHFTEGDRRLRDTKLLARDVSILKQMALADDVNLVPAFSYWNDNVEKWPDWPEGPIVRADETHLVTLANEEIERISRADGPAWESVGAPLFYGLTQPVYVPRIEKTYPCDAVLCRMARRQSPGCLIDLDKSLWAENVVGVALGLYDSMQLCHNHYHRDKTFRMGWGMIGPELEPEPHEWGQSEMLYRTNLLYYHWLNCGFHLTATGGSAIGVMPVPTGQSRTYAKLDGPLSQEKYFKAVRAGKTFATTGPMLFVKVDDHDVGSTIDWRPGKPPLKIVARVQGIQPIQSLELIHSGEIIAKTEPSSDTRPGESKTFIKVFDLKPRRSGWVAARALFRCADGSLHQAHTSPVYIRVSEKPTAFRKDAELMMQWIDRILEVSNYPKRYKSQQDREESQAVFREARAVYERVAEQAKMIWND